MTRAHKFLLILAFTLLAALASVRTVQAVVFDEDGLINADEVIEDDVYLVGESVVMDGYIKGNLIISSNSAIINGRVDGDLLINGAVITINASALVSGNVAAAAQSISFDGHVDGNLYAIGSSVTLGPAAQVGRSAFTACYSLQTQAGSRIARDLHSWGYQAQLSGEVASDANLQEEAIELNGIVGEDVIAEVSAPDPGMGGAISPFWFFKGPTAATIDSGIRVDKAAQIGGKLSYRSSKNQDNNIQAAPGEGIQFDVYLDKDQQHALYLEQNPLARASEWGINYLRDLVTLLVLGALTLWLRRSWLERPVEQAHRLLPSLVWGMLVTVAGFVGLPVLLGTIILVGLLFGIITLGGLAGAVFGVGIPGLGLAFSGFVLLVTFGSKLVVAVLLGQLLVRRFIPAYQNSAPLALLMGVVVYLLLRSVPILGWFFGLAATFVGMGAICLALPVSKRPPMPTNADGVATPASPASG